MLVHVMEKVMQCRLNTCKAVKHEITVKVFLASIGLPRSRFEQNNALNVLNERNRRVLESALTEYLLA